MIQLAGNFRHARKLRTSAAGSATGTAAGALEPTAAGTGAATATGGNGAAPAYRGVTPADRYKPLQIFIAFFFAREQFLNPLQPFDRLVAHPVLHQDFRLQHQILQRRRAQRRLSSCTGSSGALVVEVNRDSNRAELRVFHLALQHLQPFQVAGLIRIDFRRPIQALGGLGIIRPCCNTDRTASAESGSNHFRDSMRCKARSETPASPAMAVRAAVMSSMIAMNCRRSPRRRWNCSSLRANATAPSSLLTVQQTPDQPDHLLHSRWILLEQLPHQRLRLRMSPRSHQRIRIGLAQGRRHVSGIHLGFKNEDGRAHLTLPQQALSVRQSNSLIRRIFLVGPLVPLRRIATLGRHQLRHSLKRRCRRLYDFPSPKPVPPLACRFA